MMVDQLQHVADYKRRVITLAAICTVSSLLMLAAILVFRIIAPSPVILGVFILLAACTVALAYAAPVPADPTNAGQKRTIWWLLLPIAVILFALLTISSSLWGDNVIKVILALSLVVWLLLRRGTSRRLSLYFVGLGVVSGISFYLLYPNRPDAWYGALWTVILVPVSIIGGRALLDKMGLLKLGYGCSLIERSPRALITGIGLGIALGTPWALANLLLGSTDDTWIRSWAQVMGALAPGISEEAWARVFLVSFLAFLFARISTTRVALTTALLVAGCWFGYLHETPGIGSLPSAVLLGLFYSAPLALLWLRWGMETGMAFHFWQDTLRFALDVLRA